MTDNSSSESSQWSFVMLTGLSHTSSSLISNTVNTYSLLYILVLIKKIILGLRQQLDHFSCRKTLNERAIHSCRKRLNERAVRFTAELPFKLGYICWQRVSCFRFCFWFGFFFLSNFTGELLLSVQPFPCQALFLFYCCYSNEYWEPLLRTELTYSKNVPFWMNELNLKESCAGFK